MEHGAIAPLFYLPPIEYFSKIINYQQDLTLEREEHFPKQTFRNRAYIHSPNGALALIIPITKGKGAHTPMKDVKISYDFNWKRMHWQSLQTSYRNSAYFEFYEDQFAPLYEKQWKFLLDYNETMLNFFLALLNIHVEYRYASTYIKSYTDRVDLRESIHPKRPSNFTHLPYFQVFQERNGFLPNLSIVDLLFSQGKQSIHVLNC